MSSEPEVCLRSMSSERDFFFKFFHPLGDLFLNFVWPQIFFCALGCVGRVEVMAARKKRGDEGARKKKGHKDIITHLSGADFFKFLQDNNVTLRPGSEAQKNDIVVCSQRSNYADPDDMGKVLFTSKKKVKLPKGHKDGSEVNMFVMTYKKQREPRSLKGKFIFFFT